MRLQGTCRALQEGRVGLYGYKPLCSWSLYNHTSQFRKVKDHRADFSTRVATEVWLQAPLPCYVLNLKTVTCGIEQFFRVHCLYGFNGIFLIIGINRNGRAKGVTDKVSSHVNSSNFGVAGCNRCVLAYFAGWDKCGRGGLSQ